MAVPSDEAKSTLIVFSEAEERLTTKLVAVAVSSALDASAMEIVGAGSLSTISKTPTPLPILALVGLDNCILNVSLISSTASSVSEAVIVLEVCPGAKVSVVLPSAV